jgi:hypothetical protein
MNRNFAEDICAGGIASIETLRKDSIRSIGKELSSLEDVEAGMIHSADDVYTVYPDRWRDEWETKIRPAMKKISIAILQNETELSRRMLIDSRTGRSRPHPPNQRFIVAALRKLGVI